MIVLLCLGIAIILILVVLMFFVLKSTVKKINSQTKLYFVDKVQEYDYMIDEKLIIFLENLMLDDRLEYVEQI